MLAVLVAGPFVIVKRYGVRLIWTRKHVGGILFTAHDIRGFRCDCFNALLSQTPSILSSDQTTDSFLVAGNSMNKRKTNRHPLSLRLKDLNDTRTVIGTVLNGDVVQRTYSRRTQSFMERQDLSYDCDITQGCKVDAIIAAYDGCSALGP